MRNVARICLLKLADFIERRVPEDQFRMATYGDPQTMQVARAFLLGCDVSHLQQAPDGVGIEHECGTAQCAAGWLTSMYGQELRLTITHRNAIRVVAERQASSQASVTKSLGISRADADYLFMSSTYAKELLDADAYRELFDNGTDGVYEPPREVVSNRLREVVASYGGVKPKYLR